MNNPYCISFEKARDLYVVYMKSKSRANYDENIKGLTREEVRDQLSTKTGSLIESVRKLVRLITKKNEFIEFIVALQLADFYFPNRSKNICFELKKGSKADDIKSYEDLNSHIESYTYIDCQLESSGEVILFQIKRDYSDHTPGGFADWLNDKALKKKYGDMKGTTLVVMLGVPTDGSAFEIDKFYDEFMKKCSSYITFDKVCLLYNDKDSESVVLHELFPDRNRSIIKLDLAMARMRGDS